MTYHDFTFMFLLALIIALWRALVVANKQIEALHKRQKQIGEALMAGNNGMVELAKLSRSAIASLRELVIDNNERLTAFMEANDEAHDATRNVIKSVVSVMLLTSQQAGDNNPKE